jgi:predicted phosphodiesterase
VKRAIVSDIHSNLDALNAVLKDIASQGVTEILCLGDIVGYGPNPANASTW